MAVLTSSGVTFSDSTTISSKYDVIPQTDTPLYFYQSSAPTGWSQVTSNDNRMMRVVSGTGAGTGGLMHLLTLSLIETSVPTSTFHLVLVLTTTLLLQHSYPHTLTQLNLVIHLELMELPHKVMV